MVLLYEVCEVCQIVKVLTLCPLHAFTDIPSDCQEKKKGLESTFSFDTVSNLGKQVLLKLLEYCVKVLLKYIEKVKNWYLCPKQWYFFMKLKIIQKT